MKGKFLISVCLHIFNNSVQLSLLFIIWSKTEGIFVCVLSCTSQHLIHLGVTYLQPVCDFLSSKGPWFTPVAQFIYPLYYICKTKSQTTNTVSWVVDTVDSVVQGLIICYASGCWFLRCFLILSLSLPCHPIPKDGVRSI